MLDIVKRSPICNGNGAGKINGRGIRRRKLTPEQRISLATDVALGFIHVNPSVKQAAVAVGVRPDEIRAELKARAARNELEQKLQSAKRADAIVGAWSQASDKERARAFQVIGVADVWDTLANVVG